jgi:hypothetical protein
MCRGAIKQCAGSRPHPKDIRVQKPCRIRRFGCAIGGVPSLKRGIPTVVVRISRDLFLADLDLFGRDFMRIGRLAESRFRRRATAEKRAGDRLLAACRLQAMPLAVPGMRPGGQIPT